MNLQPRRRFLQGVLTAATLGPEIIAHAGAPATSPNDLEDRIRGMLIGTLLGDAIGGPIEFQAPDAIQTLPDPPKQWRAGETMDAPARLETARRLRLRAYPPLRPKPESYGSWNVDAVAGTITDDTRHKLVLLSALRTAESSERWPLGVRDLAQAYLDWPSTSAVTAHPDYVPLAADWLEEWQFSARWVLGNRDLRLARPPERMWQGLPTCCGQMTSLPLAALFPGKPSEAYRAAWQLGFFDNAWGKDLNAALVAGLATALVTPCEGPAPKAAWETVWKSMRATDPYGYGQIRWSQRAVDRWLNYALGSALEANHEPARLFAAWDQEFRTTTKWEAQVPVVVCFGCVAMAEFDPLAALQLSLEWGWDTDSYAQLVGAFVGALHGPSIFPEPWQVEVKQRLQVDHQFDFEQEVRRLLRLQQLASTKPLVAGI